MVWDGEVEALILLLLGHFERDKQERPRPGGDPIRPGV